MEEDEDIFMQRLEYYLEIGAIREAGFDENGNVLFEIDEVRTKELAPELWDAHMEYVDNSLVDLYKQGLLEVEYNEDLEATIHFTQEGYRVAKEKGVIPIDEV